MSSEAKVTAIIEARDQASGPLQTVSNSFGTFNGKMLALGTAVGAAGAAMVKIANDTSSFNQWIARAGSNVDATKEQLEDFRKVAIEASRDTMFTAEQAAAALYQMAGGSIDAKDAMEGLQQAVQFATANGFENLDDAAITVANVMTLFKLRGEEASRAMDVLTTAGHAAFGTTEELVAAFKEAAPIASQLGISIEEMSGILAGMADAGFRGTEAGVAMKRALQELITPSEDVQEKLDALNIVLTDAGTSVETFIEKADEKQMKKWNDEIGRSQKALSGLEITLEKQTNRMRDMLDKGKTSTAAYRNLQIDIENTKKKMAEQNLVIAQNTQALAGIEPATRTVRNAGGNFIGLANALDELEAKTKDMSSIERAAFLSDLFGQIAGPAMAALLGQGSEARRAYIEEMSGAEGATDRAAAAIEESVNPIKKMNDRFFEFETKIAPAVIAILNAMITVIDTLTPVISERFNVAVEHLSNLFLLVIQAAEYLNANVWPAMQAALDPVVAAFERARNAVDSFISSARRALGMIPGASAALGAMGTVKNALNLIPGGILPGIPFFEKGGVVGGPIGAPQLAVVHGGETVIPVGGQRGGINVYVSGNSIGSNVDVRYLAEQVGREVMRSLKMAQQV